MSESCKSFLRSSGPWLLLLLGVAALTGVLIWQGVGEVLHSVVEVGWWLPLIAGYHLVPMTLDAAGWRMLCAERPPLLAMIRMRWIGESVNGLLPVAQIGGEFVKTRLLMQTGLNGPTAGATVVVDLTIGFLTQIAFVFVGVGLLIWSGSDKAVTVALALGIGALAVGGFYALQRFGLFGPLVATLVRFGIGPAASMVGGANALDREIQAIYVDRRRVLSCAVLRFGAWLAGTGETYLVLHLAGVPVSIEQALVIECIGQAARTVGFAIPGGLGVQEAGYVLGGVSAGISGQAAAGLSIVRRVRELVLGVPGLIVWQFSEGRRLLLRRSSE